MLVPALAGPAVAADTVRIAAQKTGTLAWELDVIRAHGLDRRHDLTIEVTQLATPEAGKIALRGGAADIVVSDWLWVSRERALGAKLVFHPYSSALGAVMAAPTASIRTLVDLRGKKLAVAGGPIDKSWLLVQAAMKQDGLDLKTQATVAYGAPALLGEKTLLGEMDATLNYWNVCADLEARGLRRVADVADVLPKLGVGGRPAMVGYVFDEGWGRAHGQALARFLDAAREAKEILASSDAEWERIAPLTGVRDRQALMLYRDRYREGIPRRTIAEEEADARVLYRILAQQGGSELVGPATALAPGTFYRPPPAGE
ncbi:MAG TPA: ABC transporter substrate-binding protein [Xanthobacteraceae bacterium]|nr:ABC transporter substrate-binding protein [Xanthobacteraceae bacterium]